MNIIDAIKADPKDLSFDQAESVLAIVSLKQKLLAKRLYEESGLMKYEKLAA